MNETTNLLFQGESIGTVNVLSLNGEQIVINLEMPVYDDRRYQIQIDENLFNLEFTRIVGNIQIHQAVNYQAQGIIFN